MSKVVSKKFPLNVVAPKDASKQSPLRLPYKKQVVQKITNKGSPTKKAVVQRVSNI